MTHNAAQLELLRSHGVASVGDLSPVDRLRYIEFADVPDPDPVPLAESELTDLQRDFLAGRKVEDLDPVLQEA